MKFNFEDYKRFCYLLRLKPCNYASLQDYRRYFDYLEKVGA